MPSGELLKAVEEGDVSLVGKLLEHVSSKSQIDDADDDGKTALMAAARGAGVGGKEYGVIIDLLVAAYGKVGVSKTSILEAKGGRQKWNVFMHAAKCGDESNLKKISDLYDSVPAINLEGCVDWPNVDHKVKRTVGAHIYGRSPVVVTNYGMRHSRRTKRSTTAASAGSTSQEKSPKRNKKASRSVAKAPSSATQSQESLHQRKKSGGKIVSSKSTGTMDKEASSRSSQSSDKLVTPTDLVNIEARKPSAATLTTNNQKESAEQPSKSIYDMLNELPDAALLELLRKKKLIDMTQDEDAVHQPDGSGKALQSLIHQTEKLIKIKNEKADAEESLAEAKDDIEDAQELAQQQTLAVDILQGRIDNYAKMLEDAGVGLHQINSIRHRPLSSGK